MADLKDFAEQLVNLTVKEVNELADILKEKYGIEPAAAAVAVGAVITAVMAVVMMVVAVVSLEDPACLPTSPASWRQTTIQPWTTSLICVQDTSTRTRRCIWLSACWIS